MAKTTEKPSPADIITNTIIDRLEAGVRPWVKPWRPGLGGRPLRVTGEPYRGINCFWLWLVAESAGYSARTWMTYKQAQTLGGQVRQSEKSQFAIFYKTYTKEVASPVTGAVTDEVRAMLRSYAVFNVDQIEGLPDHYYGAPPPVTDPVTRIAHADAFFDATGARVVYGGAKAFYAPSSDHIHLPVFESFRDAESFVAVRAHETIHWTAPAHRVNRDLSRYHKDRSERSREELIAELGSVFLCADLGIVPELEPRPDHASYLASWLEVLSNEKRFIFSAAAHAQRAASYLHDRQPAASVAEAA